MKLKYYLRGLGIGILVTTLVLSAGGRKKTSLTDDEIRQRAEQLGMVDENEVLLAQAERLSNGTESDNSAVHQPMRPVDDVGVPDAEGSWADEMKQTASEASVPGQSPSGADASAAQGSGAEEKPAAEGSAADSSAESRPQGAAAAATKTESRTDGTAASETKTESRTDKNTAGDTQPEKKDTQTGKTGTESASSGGRQETTETPAKSTEDAGAQTPDPEDLAAGQGSAAPSGPVTIHIDGGESSTTVAKKVQQAGLVVDAAQFDSYMCLNGFDRKLVIGDHTIPAGSDARAIAEILTGKAD